MPAIKETIVTSQTPARISSETIKQRLFTDRAVLAEKEETKTKLPKAITALENRLKKWQAKAVDPTNKFVSRAMDEERRLKKQIKDKEMHLDDLDPQIKELEKRINANEEEYKQAIDREHKQHAVSGRKSDPNKPKRDAVASPARITKSNARPSHYPSSLRKAASTRAPRPGPRFQLQRNKFSPAILKDKDKNAALASKSNKQSAVTRPGDKVKPFIKASQTTKQYLSRKQLSSGAASKKAASSCATDSRAAKRPAPDDEDDSDDDLPHKGPRYLKKRKLNAATASSNPAAPSTGTNQGSNGTKKRSAPEDGEEEPSSKRQKTNLEHEETTDATASNDRTRSTDDQSERKQPPRGLVNHGLACFSNSFIQMFDTACEGHDVDSILGELSEVENFGIGQPRPRTSPRTRNSSKRVDPTRFSIEKAAQGHDTAKVSPNKHLRNVIDQLHKAEPGDHMLNKAVSAEVFRNVFAYGAPESASVRQNMSGETQECCFEYYQEVQQALVNEDPEAKTTRNLKTMFDVQTQQTDTCSKADCNYATSPRSHGSSNHHTVIVPRQRTCKLSDIYQKSTPDDKCPQCGSSTIETGTEFLKVGDNLVMNLNRTDLRKTAKSKGKDKPKQRRASKIMTEVEIDIDRIQLVGKTTYELAAIVYHDSKGESSMSGGHYTVARKCGETWYHFDDELRTTIGTEDIASGEKYGQSTMILWKKVAA